MLPTELRYFEEVASSGSIREAAERLHIAGSAVSRQISKLEVMLGASLFKRTSYGMKLTQAGRVLLDYVQRSRGEITQTQAKIRDITQMRGGDLIVFVPPELTSALVSRAVAEFRAKYSNVEVIIREASTEATLQSLLSDASDIGLALNPVPRPEIEFVAAIDHRLGLVTPASIAVKEGGALAALKTMPLATVDASSELHHLTVSAFEVAQLELCAAFTSNSIGLVKAFVCDGCGVALLPAPTVRAEVDAESSRSIRCPNWTVATRCRSACVAIARIR